MLIQFVFNVVLPEILDTRTSVTKYGLCSSLVGEVLAL